MDSAVYGFSDQDLIDLRFYCDVTGKEPGELAEGVKAGSKDPIEAKRNQICYMFLTQKRTAASVTQLVKDLVELETLAKRPLTPVEPVVP